MLTPLRHSLMTVAATCVAAMALTACGGKKEVKQSTLAKIACDESFEYIMEQEINVYEYIYPKEDVLAY